ncbi:uncharacterized protein TNCV_2993841 [Trichonephila clavipes]|nr:uncharacterized protein TNCV_2993841 [Trichonephila clavipes]
MHFRKTLYPLQRSHYGLFIPDVINWFPFVIMLARRVYGLRNKHGYVHHDVERRTRIHLKRQRGTTLYPALSLSAPLLPFVSILQCQGNRFKKKLTGFFVASESAFAMSSGDSGGFICWFSTTTVIAELGRAMSWSAQGTKKKDKNYMSLFFSENSAKTSKSFDPAKESKSWSEQTITANPSPAAPKSSSPVLTHHSTSTSTSTTTTTSTTDSVSAAPAVCGGDCGNIMCSLSPACIEEIFDDPKKPDKSNCTSPVEPPSDEASDDGSLRRRTKSEGCYSTTYRCKSGKKSVSSCVFLLVT